MNWTCSFARLVRVPGGGAVRVRRHLAIHDRDVDTSLLPDLGGGTGGTGSSSALKILVVWTRGLCLGSTAVVEVLALLRENPS